MLDCTRLIERKYNVLKWNEIYWHCSSFFRSYDPRTQIRHINKRNETRPTKIYESIRSLYREYLLSVVEDEELSLEIWQEGEGEHLGVGGVTQHQQWQVQGCYHTATHKMNLLCTALVRLNIRHRVTALLSVQE